MISPFLIEGMHYLLLKLQQSYCIIRCLQLPAEDKFETVIILTTTIIFSDNLLILFQEKLRCLVVT